MAGKPGRSDETERKLKHLRAFVQKARDEKRATGGDALNVLHAVEEFLASGAEDFYQGLLKSGVPTEVAAQAKTEYLLTLRTSFSEIRRPQPPSEDRPFQAN